MKKGAAVNTASPLYIRYYLIFFRGDQNPFIRLMVVDGDPPASCHSPHPQERLVTEMDRLAFCVECTHHTNASDDLAKTGKYHP